MGNNETAMSPNFQPKIRLLSTQSHGRMYAIIVPLVRLTNAVRIVPRLTPDNPAMAVASVDNIVVSDPVE
jgi:hypothetical protein